MTSSSSVAFTLERLIEKGTFDTRKTGDPARWFRRLTGEAGEREQAAQLQQAQRDSFASCLGPIARGLAALDRAQPGAVSDLTEYPSRTHSEITDGPRHKFAVFSLTPTQRDVSLPGQGIWGPRGKLDLMAMTLEVGYTADNCQAVELSLFLPVWGVNYRQTSPWQCSVVRLDLAGACKAKRYHYQQCGSIVPDGRNLAGHLLGVMPLVDVRTVEVTSNADEALGFPGVEVYLATVLPSLGGYLTALAKQSALTK